MARPGRALFTRFLRFLRKRTAHLTSKSSASQSIPACAQASSAIETRPSRCGLEEGENDGQCCQAGTSHWCCRNHCNFAVLAVVGIGLTTRPATANALTFLHVGSPLVSGLHIGSSFSPMAACVITVVLFLAGVVSGLSGFAFSAVAAWQSVAAAAAAGGAADHAAVRVQSTAVRRRLA